MDKKPRKMDEIIKDMEALASTSRQHSDTENNHMEADALLIEALRLLAGRSHRNEVEWLIGAYERIEKWYA